MGRSLDGLYFSTDIVGLDLCSEVGNSRMGRIVGAENFDSFLNEIRLVDILDYAQSASAYQRTR